MITAKLGNLAQIITGFTFRKETKKVGPAVLLLQSKNISQNIIIQDTTLDVVTLDTSKIQSVLQPGDVLISSRGSFRAGIIHSSKKIIATSSVFILRSDKKTINPKYLAVFLNSLNAQNQMRNVSTSGSIPSLLKSQLKNISIPIPSMEKQKIIVKLFLNIEEQKKLLERKIYFINNIADGALAHQITNL